MNNTKLKRYARSMYFQSKTETADEAEPYLKAELVEFGVTILQNLALHLEAKQHPQLELISEQIKELENLKWEK